MLPRTEARAQSRDQDPAGQPRARCGRLSRFTQEAKAASALNHPSIVTIYDVDEGDGYPFLVSEFIEGQTLRERLREGGLTLRETIEIVGQIANALAAAHAAGIVHRDVKPENILQRVCGLQNRFRPRPREHVLRDVPPPDRPCRIREKRRGSRHDY